MAIEIQKTKNGIIYFARVRDLDGKWYPTLKRRTKAEAKMDEAELIRKKSRAEGATVTAERDLTVGDFIAQWQQECRFNVSEGWQMSQDQMIRDYLLPVIGTKKLLRFRRKDGGDVMNAIQQSGKSPQTQLHVYSLMHKIFEDAVEHYEYLESNPVHKRYRPEVPRKETAFLKPVEMQTLLNFVQDHYLGRAIWIMGLAGLRWETIPPLTWGAIDFEMGQIEIRAGFKYKIREVRPMPKHKNWTTAPIVPFLRDYLIQFRPHPYDETASKMLVCPNRKGEMLSYDTFEDALKRLCEKAGVRKIAPHGLRHSCSELWVNAGASTTDVGRVLNHSNENTTRRYMHRTDDRLKSIGQAVGFT